MIRDYVADVAVFLAKRYLSHRPEAQPGRLTARTQPLGRQAWTSIDFWSSMITSAFAMSFPGCSPCFHEKSYADSGENGLSLFLGNIFDIVVSDYEMPEMDRGDRTTYSHSTHGLHKKGGHCCKYDLTAVGRQVAATALRLWEITIIPSLSAAHA